MSFNEMISHIRSRYSLLYRGPPAAPGTFRHIGVALTKPRAADFRWRN